MKPTKQCKRTNKRANKQTNKPQIYTKTNNNHIISNNNLLIGGTNKSPEFRLYVTMVNKPVLGLQEDASPPSSPLLKIRSTVNVLCAKYSNEKYNTR